MKKIIKDYYRIYSEVDKLVKEYDPCKIKNGTCSRGRMRHGKNFCCDPCKYLRNRGCTIKSIRCRAWLCHEIECRLKIQDPKGYAEFYNKRTDLLVEAGKKGFLVNKGGLTEILYPEKSGKW